MGGVQQICLDGVGNWYGVTFPGWGGGYYNRGTATYLYGNYSSGFGNDAMFFTGNKGVWMEWTDNRNYQFLLAITITDLGSPDCAPPLQNEPIPEAHNRNPAE